LRFKWQNGRAAKLDSAQCLVIVNTVKQPLTVYYVAFGYEEEDSGWLFPLIVAQNFKGGF